jgi:hypothetical protein
MSKTNKVVIVVHRKENADDFQQIARRIRNLDPSIGVLMVSDFLTSKMVPPEFLQLPMLVIYLCNPPATEFKVATKIAVKKMSKIEEYEHFKKHKLPCLPIDRFKWGMELDPAIYGDWVVLKPEHIQSTGKDVNMVPTKKIPHLKLSDFPEAHLIRQDSYYVQKFVKAGPTPVHYRALVFLDEILYSSFSTHQMPYPTVDSSLSSLLSRSITANWQGKRKIDFTEAEEVIRLALRTSKSFENVPLLGIDFIYDDQSKRFYILETNPGGNVWHFSSEIGKGLRRDLGGKNLMVAQYNAWDKAAKALIRKTIELAK